MRAAELLGAEGPLARNLEGYELREPQLEMARLVEDTLEHEGVALIEAGTGTGKTLAYLVPALRSGKKVVVSTGTRTLQDQIMEVDLPALRRHLGIEVHAACMKGLSNYLCRRRYRELLDGPDAEAPAVARRLPVLMDWLEHTDHGDRAELTGIAEHDAIWTAVQSGTDTRIGPRCRYHDECFVTATRRRADEAQLVVVNHHLFFADLALRGPHGGGVLPAYDAVIFDEAHQVEDVATLFFGVQVSDHRLERLLRDAERALLAARLLDGSAHRDLSTLRLAGEAFFARLPAAAGPGRLELPEGLFEGPDADRYHALDAALEALELRCVRQAGESESVAQLARRAGRIRDALGRLAEGAGASHVTWAEQRGASRVVGASPVDVSAVFREEVLHRVPSVVLTSATLATGGTFAFAKQRLGIDFEVDERILPSPFDYGAQAALYVPPLPDPRAPGYFDAAADEVTRLVRLTRGGAFVLCTSLRMMERFAERCRPRLRGRPIYVQGDAPKGALLERFRADGDAVLFATMSFWQGVDVPGEALRLVVMDKLPFDVPSDPLVEARCRRLEEEGEKPFVRYLVPSAALTLEQGFGRLIRTRRDRGIVAVLDSRLLTKGYGKIFLRTLPPATRCETFADVERFWTGGSAVDAPGEEDHVAADRDGIVRQ
ncbi:MAG TPA: ATP-dependent DNA helicase [Sandaracinaceae bacterium LLY-WYZ-13_1]|nr:ATP-dependent DNA helicase [Sandaracinaceae bacterium LLY-WYZ-13_1]